MLSFNHLPMAIQPYCRVAGVGWLSATATESLKFSRDQVSHHCSWIHWRGSRVQGSFLGRVCGGRQIQRTTLLQAKGDWGWPRKNSPLWPKYLVGQFSSQEQAKHRTTTSARLGILQQRQDVEERRPHTRTGVLKPVTLPGDSSGSRCRGQKAPKNSTGHIQALGKKVEQREASLPKN